MTKDSYEFYSVERLTLRLDLFREFRGIDQAKMLDGWMSLLESLGLSPVGRLEIWADRSGDTDNRQIAKGMILTGKYIAMPGWGIEDRPLGEPIRIPYPKSDPWSKF